MASSLATHQFAGVSAQFKCVRARRRRGDIRDNPLPDGERRDASDFPSGGSDRNARRATSRSIAPRARFPGRMADDAHPSFPQVRRRAQERQGCTQRPGA